jgi:hypothetical protein
VATAAWAEALPKPAGASNNYSGMYFQKILSKKPGVEIAALEKSPLFKI